MPSNIARFNMIEQQIRTWEVLDPTVLALLDAVPRENFVAEAQRGLAFADIELPIGHGQTMLSP
ncbi:MAG TPA: protein-L-isoaspartate O-methyltransferase, partial [Methylophilaceae bacterium]|nr:protein-L-isoaspartate O-methyltransferase [Methylophilaceae bacterium]